LNGVCLSASSHATAQCLIALRDTDLSSDLVKIKIPMMIMHCKKVLCHVYIEGIVIGDDRKCLLSVFDISGFKKQNNP